MNAKSEHSDWADPDDAPELTEEFFKKGTWHIAGKAVSSDEGGKAMRNAIKRGRPRKDVVKLSVSIRLPADVVAHFKRDGKGWQTRIGEALQEYVEAHS